MAKPTFAIEPYCDDLGPEKVLYVSDRACGLRGIVVVDNTACGAAIGGVRMAADVSTDEVFRLARAMTLKNAAAGLPHGGGKSGIIADPGAADKPRLLRAFARAIRHLVDYIPGPDMGTDETCMAWIHDEIGRAVGLPRVFGGIPLDELGATGYGLACSAEVAAPFCGLKLPGARVIVEGFGNVGRHAAAFLAKLGAKLVAASDAKGAIYNPDGIEPARLAEVKRKAGRVTAYESARSVDPHDMLALPCDILVPAARPDSLTKENATAVQARLILSGANIPATPDAEVILHQRDVVLVPDFIANAGGVICAATEFHGGTEAAAFEQIAQKIRRNTIEVLTRSRDEKVLPRAAAERLAGERVRAAMALRKS